MQSPCLHEPVMDITGLWLFGCVLLMPLSGCAQQLCVVFLFFFFSAGLQQPTPGYCIPVTHHPSEVEMGLACMMAAGMPLLCLWPRHARQGSGCHGLGLRLEFRFGCRGRTAAVTNLTPKTLCSTQPARPSQQPAALRHQRPSSIIQTPDCHCRRQFRPTRPCCGAAAPPAPRGNLEPVGQSPRGIPDHPSWAAGPQEGPWFPRGGLRGCCGQAGRQHGRRRSHARCSLLMLKKVVAVCLPVLLHVKVEHAEAHGGF